MKIYNFKKYQQKYRALHKEVLKERAKIYREKHKQEIYEKNKKYRQSWTPEQKEKQRIRCRLYWIKNRKLPKEKGIGVCYDTLFRRKYSQYKGSVKGTQKKWQLTPEDFKEFWQKPCYYCGSGIETIGIDRVNNSIGYLKQNCVPCCSICNKAKLKLTEKEFTEHCLKVVKHYFK